MSPKNYKIIHLPAYRDPYQKSLVHHQRKLGIDAVFGLHIKYHFLVNLSPLYNVLIYLISDFRPSIIHLHWQHPFLIGKNKISTWLKSTIFLLQLSILRILGSKVIWTVHNLKDHENEEKSLEIYFSRFLAKYVSNAIISHCKYSTKEIIKQYRINAKKIYQIPHGDFIKYFPNNVKNDILRKEVGLAPEDFVFLFFGQIKPYKGVLELIASFKRLRLEHAKLIIAGKANDPKYCEIVRKNSSNNKNIIFVSKFILDDQIQVYMNIADAVVYPYLDVLNSGGVFTGMSFGKVIIAPKLGCIPEVLEKGTSFLYDPHKEGSLYETMKDIYNQKEKIAELGMKNIACLERYNWRDISRKTYRLYEKVMA